MARSESRSSISRTNCSRAHPIQGCDHGQLAGADDREHRAQSDAWTHVIRRRGVCSRVAPRRSAFRLAVWDQAVPPPRAGSRWRRSHPPHPHLPPVARKAFTSLPFGIFRHAPWRPRTHVEPSTPPAPFPVSGGHTPCAGHATPSYQHSVVTPRRTLYARPAVGVRWRRGTAVVEGRAAHGMGCW